MLRDLLPAAGVLVLAGVGAFLGTFWARARKPFWLIGCLAPLLLIVMVGATRYIPVLQFQIPFRWLVQGFNEYFVFAVSIPMLFFALLPGLQGVRLKILLIVFACIVEIYYCFMPFVGPVLVRNELLGLKTKFNGQKVCIQSTGYTCGPAAAATALKQLGIEAQEGRLAILCHTNPYTGTPADVLYQSLTKEFSKDGVVCRYRYFRSVAELEGAGVVIALVKYSFLVDHYVTVLEVTDRCVMVADPLVGRVSYTHKEFEEIWRFAGIEIDRGQLEVR